MTSTAPKSTPTELTVVGSDANDLGIEVTHTHRPNGTEQLRAYRCGELVATRLVERHEGRAFGDCVEYARGLDDDLRTAARVALDEGVRILRDGQGIRGAA